MDANRFDRLVLTLTRPSTRRSAVALLSAVGLTGLVRQETAAQSCIENGERCDPKASPNGCCSGKCSRRRKKCRSAPDQSICTIENNTCAGTARNCTAGGSGNCRCHVTTRGFSFCGVNFVDCTNCETDRDCEKRPNVGQRGDRCVVCATSLCEGNRGCTRKCANPA